MAKKRDFDKLEKQAKKALGTAIERTGAVDSNDTSNTVDTPNTNNTTDTSNTVDTNNAKETKPEKIYQREKTAVFRTSTAHYDKVRAAAFKQKKTMRKIIEQLIDDNL